MGKNVLKIILLILIALQPASAAKKKPKIKAIPHSNQFVWRTETNNVLKPGEKLYFSIKWEFIVVGYAFMTISDTATINNRECFHIVTEAKSAPFFDNFFKVRDTNESWMDTQSLCSQKFRQNISEGSYKNEETILFNHSKNKYQILESGKEGKIQVWTQDILSSIYYLRTKDIAVGMTYSIDTHSGDKSWPLTVKVLRKEVVKVPAGEFECFVVEPSIREGSGLFNSKGGMLVWLTADENKTPVMMSSKIAIGSIDAVLGNN